MRTFDLSSGHISAMTRPFGAPRILMDENAAGGGDAGGSDSIAVREAPSGTPDSLTIQAAARTLANVRRSKPAEPVAATVEPEAAPAATETEIPAAAEAVAETESPQGDAAQPEPAATGETQEKAPAAEPTRPLPRSWTKEQTDYWTKLDPATQDFLIEQDRKASEAVRRSQNDAAEKSKALSAKEQAAEQARTEFENRAKAALNILLREQQRDFPDIKSMDDVRNLAASDPLRYLQWQAHQQDLQVQAAAVQEAEKRATESAQSKRQSYSDEQTNRLKELIPDFADAKKLSDARDRALPLLTDDYGFSLEQLQKWNSTEAGFEILQSAGFQKLVADMLASRDRDATRAADEARRAAEEAKRKAAVKAQLAKPDVPPVQRPGSAPTPGDAASQNLKSLAQKLTQSGSEKDAFALLQARRAASRR